MFSVSVLRKPGRKKIIVNTKKTRASGRIFNGAWFPKKWSGLASIRSIPGIEFWTHPRTQEFSNLSWKNRTVRMLSTRKLRFLSGSKGLEVVKIFDSSVPLPFDWKPPTWAWRWFSSPQALGQAGFHSRRSCVSSQWRGTVQEEAREQKTKSQRQKVKGSTGRADHEQKGWLEEHRSNLADASGNRGTRKVGTKVT